MSKERLEGKYFPYKRVFLNLNKPVINELPLTFFSKITDQVADQLVGAREGQLFVLKI